mgnify:CR=1 FL=1
MEAYEEVRPLSEREKEFAALSLAYPGKFKKIAGSYYRSNKAHLSEKNVEKLQICIRQTEEKYEFLSRIFPFEFINNCCIIKHIGHIGADIKFILV